VRQNQLAIHPSEGSPEVRLQTLWNKPFHAV